MIAAILESGIMAKLVASAIKRKRRMRDYSSLTQDIALSISEYDHKSDEEPWKRAHIEMAVHFLGNLLTLEDDNYLKLTGVVLRRFMSFMTPEREGLFKERSFLNKLEKNILHLGESISYRRKRHVVNSILDFYNLTYKYPKFLIDEEKSAQLESDVILTCHKLRGREPYSAYLASRILDQWNYETIRETEPSLILIGTNTRLMLDDFSLASGSSRNLLALQVERSIQFRETDVVRSFDAQSNALAAIMLQRPAWKPTKFTRSIIHIYPRNQAELDQIPLVAWIREKGPRHIFA